MPGARHVEVHVAGQQRRVGLLRRQNQPQRHLYAKQHEHQQEKPQAQALCFIGNMHFYSSCAPSDTRYSTMASTSS